MSILTSPNLLILVALIICLAFFVRGLTGFGAGLILTPLLSFLLDIRLVVLITATLMLATGLYLVILTYKDIASRQLAFVIVPSGLCCLIGSFSLLTIDTTLLLKLLGLITLIYALYTLFKAWQPAKATAFSLRPHPIVALILSALSGFLQGMYGTGGPPIVILLSQMIERKEQLRATLICYFLSLNLMRWVAYLILLDRGTATTSFSLDYGILILLVPAVIGSYAGVKAQQWVDEQRFRNMVSLLLLLSGVLLLLK